LQYVRPEELSALIVAIHRTNQLNLPVILTGAGLPQLRALAGEAKSYAERLFDFPEIGSLSAEDARTALAVPAEESGASIDGRALDVMVERSHGYPYFLQEWGYHVWNVAPQSPITVDDVLSSPMIAWPFRMLMCCLVTDGGGALILTSAERARDFPRRPVYVLGTGESVETPMVSQMEDFNSSRAFRVSGAKAFDEAGIGHADVDHLMIYDAFAHLPLYGLEDLGFCKPGEAAAFVRERNTAPGGALPLNTNGGGLSYMHSGMYGMYALQESVRQMRGIAPAQVPGAKISVSHGVGGMFAASGTIIFGSEAP